MIKNSSEKLSMALVLVAVVAILLVLSVPPTLADDQDDGKPPCVAKIHDCIRNGAGEMNTCCSVWADQVQNARECFCENIDEVGGYEDVFKSCNINFDPSTMCKDDKGDVDDKDDVADKGDVDDKDDVDDKGGDNDIGDVDDNDDVDDKGGDDDNGDVDDQDDVNDKGGNDDKGDDDSDDHE